METLAMSGDSRYSQAHSVKTEILIRFIKIRAIAEIMMMRLTAAQSHRDNKEKRYERQ